MKEGTGGVSHWRSIWPPVPIYNAFDRKFSPAYNSNMLTEKDLKSIKGLIDNSIESNNEKLIDQVKDLIEFSAEKSEQRIEERMEVKMENLERRLDQKITKVVEKINREVTDIALMNREFLGKLGNHETRIGQLELKTGLATK